MASENKTSGSVETRTISERLNQSAYSYYSSTAVVPSGDRSTATGLKRFFAAALLSSSSIMVLSSPAAAEAAVCTPSMPANGATVNCTSMTNMSQRFTGDDLTIIADQNFIQDTRGNTVMTGRVNAGIYISGSGGTIQHSGTIRTGEIPEGGGGPYGRHNGLYIIGGAGNVSAENTATGYILTTVQDSAGIQVSATTGTSTAINRGTIETEAEGSYGVAASNAYTAISRNYGTVTTSGDQSHGLYSFSNGRVASSTSTNASGGPSMSAVI